MRMSAASAVIRTKEYVFNLFFCLKKLANFKNISYLCPVILLNKSVLVLDLR